MYIHSYTLEYIFIIILYGSYKVICKSAKNQLKTYKKCEKSTVQVLKVRKVNYETCEKCEKSTFWVRMITFVPLCFYIIIVLYV